jgi:DNA mismatch endonuclease, patch repair protein
MDIVSKAQRSRMMGRITGRNTQPERVVRKLLRELGVGYRLHVATLPGKPDIVMQGRRKIVEVRGCFWHRHEGCPYAYRPKSNVAFWEAKFASNVVRDKRNDATLRNSGWQVLIVWECEIADVKLLVRRLKRFVARRGDRSEAKRQGLDHRKDRENTVRRRPPGS